MARVDLHLHTEFSPDSRNRLTDVVAQARHAGLSHLAVTDHNMVEGALRLKELSDLPVIVGEEIMTAQGELIGLFLREPVPAGMSAVETVEAIRGQGGLVHVPHPKDPFRHGLRPEALMEIRDHVDVLEVFNARCLLRSSNRAALALARSLGTLACVASDAHTLGEIGGSYVDGPDFHDAAGLLETLAQGRMRRHRSGAVVHLASRAAALRRRHGRNPD